MWFKNYIFFKFKVVPFNLGQKLFEATREICDVAFQEYPKDLGLGHTDIFRHENIASTIRNFVRASIEKL